MKITKILVALSFLFAVSTAHAGEMAVTGSMKATYQSEQDATTGNPLGMDREITFSGSTELDNGITMSVMQDFDDAGAFGNAKLTFGNVMGMVDIYVGTDGSEMDAIDDITPTAFEEANGGGSGTYQDIGTLANEMGIGIKVALPIVGSVAAQYVPKVDGAENADGTASADTSASVGSGYEVVTKTALGDLPVVGSFLDGNTLTLGVAEDETSTIANTDERFEATVALTGSYGNFSYGYQKEHINAGKTAAADEDIRYTIDTVGIAYAINDSLSVSYNITEEQKSDNTDADIGTYKQETDAFSIGYSIGGLTFGFQEASTDNANQVVNSKDDTRRIQITAAF